MKRRTLEALISCRLCGTKAVETMPENACQHFCRCSGRGAALRPVDGDCRVFWSDGDSKGPQPGGAAQLGDDPQ